MMKNKKIIFQSLIGVAALGLVAKMAAGNPLRQKTKKLPDSTDSPFPEIDEFIKAQMQRLHIPGASLAIIEGNMIVYQQGFGKARPNGEVPTPETPFLIGSLTKSITAMAIMQLVEAGKVELDAPVQRYLPWFHIADLQASAKMTVRHLLNQTSGLPLLPSLAQNSFYEGSDAIEREVRKLSTLKIKNAVGEKCEYSNLNYDILGLIIQVVSGKSYEEYVQEHIFNPLKMSRSYTSKKDAKQNGLAVGYRHWFSFPIATPNMPYPRSYLPSGQLISCTEDLAHFLIAHLNKGRYDNKQILSAAGIDVMHRGAKELTMMGQSGGLYGMGWFDENLGKLKTYYHGGNVPDFSSFAGIIPDQKRGIVILFNADPYGLPPVIGEIAIGALSLLAGLQPAPIKLNFIQWIMRCLPLIPLLQILGVLNTFGRLRHWNLEPLSIPTWGQAWTQNILFPLIPNLVLAGFLVYLNRSKLIKFMRLFVPDLALIANISGWFVGIWVFLRTGLLIRALIK